jgi:putative transposase
LIRKILKPLPKKDYPALDTFSFVSVWLEYVMDKSIVSMRDLFKRLNNQGIDLKISNFSKASKHRDTQVFLDIINELNNQLRNKKGKEKNQVSNLNVPGLYLHPHQRKKCQAIMYS